MHKYPQNQSCVGASGQTRTTNMSMILCDWQIRPQIHVSCGRTTSGTDLNWAPNPYTRCGLDKLDKAVAYTKRGGGGGTL